MSVAWHAEGGPDCTCRFSHMSCKGFTRGRAGHVSRRLYASPAYFYVTCIRTTFSGFHDTSTRVNIAAAAAPSAGRLVRNLLAGTKLVFHSATDSSSTPTLDAWLATTSQQAWSQVYARAYVAPNIDIGAAVAWPSNVDNSKRRGPAHHAQLSHRSRPPCAEPKRVGGARFMKAFFELC